MADGINAVWHVVHGDNLMDLMRRCAAGEDPDVLYIEEYANGTQVGLDEPSPDGTSALIDRVARAIREAADLPFDDPFIDYWPQWQALARAAIEAIDAESAGEQP